MIKSILAICLVVVVLSSRTTATKADIKKIITTVAIEEDLDPALLLGLVEQESNFNVTVGRFEPHLMKRFGKKELATSWGLTQVVWGFHRDLCNVKTVRQLLIPINNVRCGARVLKSCLNRYQSLFDALSCYNGDKTGRYANSVISRYKRYIYQERGYTKDAG